MKVALAILLMTASSFAADEKPVPANVPDADHPHFVLGGVLGSCTRHDPNVGVTSVCGEATLGVDFPFSTKWVHMHVGGELGFGANTQSSTGDSMVGLAVQSGGAFLSARAWLTYDATRLLFLRGGPEILFAYDLETVTPSVHGFLDFGTRFFSSVVELGLRAYIGVDGLTKTGDAITSYSTAFAWGAGVFMRFQTP